MKLTFGTFYLLGAPPAAIAARAARARNYSSCFVIDRPRLRRGEQEGKKKYACENVDSMFSSQSARSHLKPTLLLQTHLKPTLLLLQNDFCKRLQNNNNNNKNLQPTGASKP
jgi:hypothetical protein